MSGEAWEISDFQTPSGSYPVRRFLSKLTMEQKANALALIQLLRERGNTLRRPHSGSLGDGLFELRDVSSGCSIHSFLAGGPFSSEEWSRNGAASLRMRSRKRAGTARLRGLPAAAGRHLREATWERTRKNRSTRG
jgi:hypothetical protein